MVRKYNLPDYKGGSIVNLTCSIQKALGGNAIYPTLKLLPPEKLREFDTIVLLVVDGMGYKFLEQQGVSTFSKHLAGKMTSVFLPSTACAITSMLTGVAPQQHAITGWFMHLKTLGGVAVPLRFAPRGSETRYTAQGVQPKEIFDFKSGFDKLSVRSFIIYPSDIVYSDYNNFTSSGAERLKYRNLNGFTRKIKKAVRARGKKVIYAYWPTLDHLMHHHGTKSKLVRDHFKELEQRFIKLLKWAEGKNACIIATADHGLIDTTPARTVNLLKDKVIKECLTLPLCGDFRTVYCYVHPSKAKKFESYVKKHLKPICRIYKSEELIKKGYFGLYKPNPKLFDRVGDYTIMPKENYSLIDTLVGQKPHFMKGAHGGLSDEELYVPLIVIDCNEKTASAHLGKSSAFSDDDHKYYAFET